VCFAHCVFLKIQIDSRLFGRGIGCWRLSTAVLVSNHNVHKHQHQVHIANSTRALQSTPSTAIPAAGGVELFFFAGSARQVSLESLCFNVQGLGRQVSIYPHRLRRRRILISFPLLSQREALLVFFFPIFSLIAVGCQHREVGSHLNCHEVAMRCRKASISTALPLRHRALPCHHNA
jgi:hypothetical protein